MSLKNTNKLETNKYELTIGVDAQVFESGVEKVYRKNVKSINVPGFRRGKAPRKMVEKLYGEGVFFEDAINELYPAALKEAVEEAKLELVAPPSIEVKEVKKEDGFEFVAICITKPEVSVKDYKGIKAKKVVKTVEDKAVSDRLEAMRSRNARQLSVSDRAAKIGDMVVFDFDGSVDGVHFDGGKAEAFSLELGSGQFIPGFEEQLVGKNINDEFDVNVTFPENYQAEELKGKAAVFACKLHEIKEKELPVLDDEFAKDVSEFDTLTELESDIRAKLQETTDVENDAAMENSLIDSVIENMTAEIPHEMYDSRIDELMQDFEYRLSSQGMNMDMYLQYTGMDEASFRMTFEEQAKKQVQIRLALEEIARVENIEASEEDIAAEYVKLAEAYKTELDKVKSFIFEKELKKDIQCNKAIDLVKKTAVITEEKEAAPKAKAPAKAKAAPKAKASAEEKSEPAAKKPAAKKPAAKAKKTEE